MAIFRVVLLILSVSIGSAQAQSIGFSVSEGSSNLKSLTVMVVDDQTQTPITDANVTVTDSMDSSVEALMDPQSLSPLPKTVTVSKTGYATLSVVGVQTSQMTAYLHPLVSQKTVLASGTINDWDGATTDDTGVARGGLVFQTISAMDLLQFQVSDFVSPLKDTLDLGGLAGKHNIPSNIVLPSQTINYYIDIDVNKPLYRLPIPASQSLGLTGLEVEADVGDVVSASSSHTFDYDLLNKIRFKRVGMTHKFSATQDTVMNVNATLPLVPEHQVSLSSAPPFEADVIAAALSDMNGDKTVLVPSDLKTVLNSQSPDDSRTVTLVAPQSTATANRAVAVIAIGNKGTQISGQIISSAGKTIQAGEFLNTELLPQDQGLPATVSVRAPTQGVGVAIFETDQPVWYVYTLPIAGNVNLPTAGIAFMGPIQSYSVNSISFSKFNEKAVDGTKIMALLQRFARSSAKIKQ